MRLEIVLPPESSNISYSYGVLHRFQTPFRTFSHFIPPNTGGAAGNRVCLGSVDKQLRLKAPKCQDPSGKGFLFRGHCSAHWSLHITGCVPIILSGDSSSKTFHLRSQTRILRIRRH